MNLKNSNLEEVLTKQLKKKGIEQGQMPLFIKNLVNTLSVGDSLDLSVVNNQLHVLGWTDFELDYHTFQLVKAYIEILKMNNGFSDVRASFLPGILNKSIYFEKVAPERITAFREAIFMLKIYYSNRQ